MAKAIPMPKSGKSVVVLLIVVAVVAMVINDPVGAAGIAKSIGTTIGDACGAIITFFRSLTS